ncbi:MAG TPA: HAD-IA family hydrolase [Thermomicrobiales bacterium]|nr:HAD-IA family hydrolase [Thermomicrobiales bacterium]
MTYAFDLTVAGFLFDMDGTLVDSTAIVEEIWTEFAPQHGLVASEIISQSHGRQAMDTLAHFLPHLSWTEHRALADDLNAQEEVLLDGIIEIAGASALMRTLMEIGAPVALVTSAHRQLALARMAVAGVPMPPVVVTAEDISRGKPAPDGYLRAADLLGVPARDCLGFEDAELGLLAVIAAGAQPVVIGPHVSPTTSTIPRLTHYDGLTVSRNGDRFRIRE